MREFNDTVPAVNIMTNIDKVQQMVTLVLGYKGLL